MPCLRANLQEFLTRLSGLKKMLQPLLRETLSMTIKARISALFLVFLTLGCATAGSHRGQIVSMTVKKEDTLNIIAKKYDTTWQAIVAMNRSQLTNGLREGQELRVKVGPKAEIATELDDALADDQAEDDEELAFLKDRKRSEGFLFGRGKSDPPKLVYPVEGRISSHYGRRRKRLHKGIDIAAYIGTPIVAAGDGEVIFSGRRRGYGSTVVIDHGQFMTLYAHASKLIARRGDRVRQGDFIAKVGRTGNARGVHLHFEIRDSENRPLDPEKYLFANNIAQSNSQSNIRYNSQLSQPVGSPKFANGQSAVLPKTKRKTKSKSKPKINISQSKQRKGKKGLLYAKD